MEVFCSKPAKGGKIKMMAKKLIYNDFEIFFYFNIFLKVDPFSYIFLIIF
jgi:hypothetical protein